MGSEWHPIFLTDEVTAGVWEMKHATTYGPFGRVELRRVNGNLLRYKVTLGNEVIGWAGSLQVACERLYVAWVDRQEAGRRGPPNGNP
jgi:hypothetical protein